jgi:hypothetical protein
MNTAANWRTPTVVLVCAAIILTLALGVRQTFGLFNIFGSFAAGYLGARFSARQVCVSQRGGPL